MAQQQPRRSRYSIAVDSIVGTLAGSLILGFFWILWTTSTTLKDTIGELKTDLDRTRTELRAQQQVFASEVALLKHLLSVERQVDPVDEEETAEDSEAPEWQPQIKADEIRDRINRESMRQSR